MNRGLKALKRITSNSTCYVSQDYDMTNYDADVEVVEKELKALEIMFEKRIDLESFYTSFIEGNRDYNFYDITYGTYGLECLTEEEFDLLKEMAE